MIWALKNNEKIRAIPNERALCPTCREEVISKCGDIKIWHWSHKADNDCDSWSEGETEWHLKWKNEFPKEWQEVVIGEHRADVYSYHKLKILELQNSSISQDDIQKREYFYKEMIWLLNGESLAKNINFFDKGEYYSFKWKWFPKSWSISTKPIFIDLNYQILQCENEIDKYSNGKKHFSTIRNYTYEWEDDSGNIREGDYRHYYTESYEDTENHLNYLKKLKKKREEKDIFLIKKINENGTGWGRFITKEEFLKQFI